MKNIILIVLLTLGIIYPQNENLKTPFYPPLKTELLSEKVVVDIFPDDEYRPNVEVFIDGKGPFLFGIDWGLNAFVISKELSDELDLKKAGTFEMPDGSEDYVEVKELKIGDALFKGSTAFAKDLLDKRIKGVLGFNVFEKLLMTFDFPSKKLIFQKGGLPEPDGNEIISLANIDVGERPDIEVKIGKLKFDAVLDTRAFGWLIINEKYMNDLTLYGKRNEMLGRGPQMGTMNITSSRVKESLRIKDIEVENPIIKFRNKEGAIIGMDFMKNFVITLDKINGRVKFKSENGYKLKIPEEEWEKENFTESILPKNPEKYTGKYGKRTITLEDGHLYLQREIDEKNKTQNGRRVKIVAPKLRLAYKENNEFDVERIPGAKLKFIKDENGNIIELHIFNPSLGWDKETKEN